MQVVRALTVGLWIGAIAFHVHNALSYPLDGTDDARFGHLRYIRYVKEHWQQPAATVNWETWQPPLYHWGAAGLWAIAAPLSSRPDDIFSLPQRALIPLASSVLGLLTACIAAKMVHRLLPNDALAQLLALALILFWPMHVILAPWVRNDLLAVLLASVTLRRLVGEGDLTHMTRRSAVCYGMLAGLGLLAKYTGLSILIMLGVSLGAAAVRDRAAAAAAFHRFAIICVVAGTVAGWFYADHWIKYGKPFATSHDLIQWRQPPGTRNLYDFVSFTPAVFVRPWVRDARVIHSVWAGTYATAWFDGQYIFLNHYMSRPTAELAGRILLVLGLLPTLAIGVGSYRSLVLMIRTGRLLPYVPLFALSAWTFAAYIYANTEMPYYSVVKAHFLMPAVVPLTVFFAHTVAAAPRWLRAILAANVAMLTIATTVVFSFGVVH